MDQTNYVYLQSFATHLRAKKLQPESIRAYCADIQQYLEWLTEHELESPFSATTQNAHEFVMFLSLPTHTLRARIIGPYSISTIARKVKTLRYFYDFLSESEDK